MTKNDITYGASTVVRHVMTVGAGLLAAHGIAGGDQLEGIGSAVAVFIATVAWSFIEKSKLLETLCEALPVSELEALAKNLGVFRANGANPLLIANIAHTALAVAQQELMAAHPELAMQAPSVPAATASPAPAAPALSPAGAPQQEPVSEPMDLTDRARVDIPGVTS